MLVFHLLFGKDLSHLGFVQHVHKGSDCFCNLQCNSQALQLAGTATRAILIRMSNFYGVRDCQGDNIEAPVRMNELLIQGWGTVGGKRGTTYGATDGPRGTKYSAVDGPGDQLSRDSATSHCCPVAKLVR